MARLPPHILDQLEKGGFRFVVRMHSVAEEFDLDERALRPRGYPPGSRMADVTGVFRTNENRAVMGVRPTGDVAGRPDAGVVLHEVGHALDHARGYPSRGADFEVAFNADARTEPFKSGYFSDQSKGGVHTSHEDAASEVYAEALQVYYRDPARLQRHSPNLYDYFQRTEPKGPPP